MLQLLRVRNFVLIESLEINFNGGFNVITGETGTGKSIVLDAVALILGARADASFIRSGEDEAVVEALFDVSTNAALTERLASKGLISNNTEPGELLIKRVIHKNGRGRVFINGEIATLSQLVDISENLVDLCSQHEHQSLVRSGYQLELLDRYAGLTDNVNKIAEIYNGLISKKSELEALQSTGTDALRTEDFIRFQIQEIEAFNPLDGEEEQLIQEKRALQSVKHLLDACSVAGELIGASDATSSEHALNLLSRALKRLTKAEELDDRLSTARAPLERALMELEESLSQLSTYVENLQTDPIHLEKIEDRLATWSQMKRKYGSTAQDIIATKNRLNTELANIEQSSERQLQLEKEITSIESEYVKLARKLSTARQASATVLSHSIQAELNELLMTGTVFKVVFSGDATQNNWSPHGFDSIEFVFSPNIGEGLKPLGKMASGGELSRMMLAIRRVVSVQGGICVYLFDEIDAGIGGQTAAVVGRKIKSVAKHNQVICITHLPQIAAFAETHFSVSKNVSKGRTISNVQKLSKDNRIDELTRMSGAVPTNAKAKAHATELLKQCQH